MRGSDRALCLSERAIFAHQLLGVALLRARLVPGDAQRVPALQRRPHPGGINRNARRQCLDVDHARDFSRIDVIDRSDLGVEPRRTRDHDGEHVRLANIDGELRRAVGLRRHVELFDCAFLADQPELRRILERRVLPHPQFRRRFRERAELAFAS